MSYPDLSEKTMIEAVHAWRVDRAAPFIRMILPELKGKKPYAIINNYGTLYVLANEDKPVIVFTGEDVNGGKVPGAEDEALLRENGLKGTFDDRDYDLIAGPSGKTAYDLLKDIELSSDKVRIVKLP